MDGKARKQAARVCGAAGGAANELAAAHERAQIMRVLDVVEDKQEGGAGGLERPSDHRVQVYVGKG